jgi:hypothetical protein
LVKIDVVWPDGQRTSVEPSDDGPFVISQPPR